MSRRIMLRIFTLFMVCLLHTTILLCQKLEVSSTPVSCNGDSNGEITASISNCNGEYIVRLVHASNNKLISKKQFQTDTTITFSDLVAYEYKVQIISTIGLLEKLMWVIEPKAIKVKSIEVVKQPSGIDACDGIVKLNPVGGNPPYTYKWSENTGNATTAQLEELCFGIYDCFIQDRLNCSKANATVVLINQEKDN